MSASSVARTGTLAMLACPSDREIIALANAVFADQPRQSEGRRDNDLFYIRAIKALIDSQAEARADVAELLAKAEQVAATIELPTIVRQSTKNSNAGFIDWRDWCALKGEVMALREALARCNGNGGVK